MTIEQAKNLMARYKTVNYTDTEAYKNSLREILLGRKYMVICYHPIHQRTFLWVNLSYEETMERIISLKKQGFIVDKRIVYSAFCHNHKPWFEIEGEDLKEFITSKETQENQIMDGQYEN